MCSVVYARNSSPRRATSRSPRQSAITITITEPEETQPEIEGLTDPVSPYPDQSLLVVPEPEDSEEPDLDLDLDEPSIARPIQAVGYSHTSRDSSVQSLSDFFQLYAAGIKWSRSIVTDRGRKHGTFEHMLATLVLSLLLVTIPVVVVVIPVKWVLAKLEHVQREWSFRAVH